MRLFKRNIFLKKLYKIIQYILLFFLLNSPTFLTLWHMSIYNFRILLYHLYLTSPFPTAFLWPWQMDWDSANPSHPKTKAGSGIVYGEVNDEVGSP